MTTGPHPIGLPPGIAVEVLGQDERKYRTANPVVKWLIDRLIRRVRAQMSSHGGVHVDVGVGEGFALQRIAAQRALVIGLEFRTVKLEAALRRVEGLTGVVGDAGMLPFRDSAADLVTCIEVLEHLQPFEPAVAELARITGGRCVISVPWEPWFRLGNLGRGKNLRRWGNDPEHVQHFSVRSLRRALDTEFSHVEVRRCFPWLIAVASPPHRHPSDAPGASTGK